MSARLRCLFAAVFAALFLLLPGPDDQRGKPYLGYLQVRAALLGPDSPFAQLPPGPVPPLQVDLRQSPPLVDPAQRAARLAEFARLAAEWAQAQRPPRAVDAALPPLPLAVRIGEHGVQAEWFPPAGAPWRHAAPFPTRLSLLPAVLAIGLALLTQRVVLALLLAGLAGAIAHVASGFGAPAGALAVAGEGVAHFAVDVFWRRAIGSDFYLRISLFVMFLFMTIAVMTRSGGIHGLVHWLQRRVRGPVSAQLCTYATGLAIFFDDYSNCLLAGTAMRPLCDAARVSREKLAWLVDSTAAPVAGLSVFSTWVLYEVSQYATPLQWVTRADGTPYAASDAFGVFLQALPYRFYCLFTLLLLPLVVLLRRDLGPMLAAERRARRTGQVSRTGARPLGAGAALAGEPPPDRPRRARNAVLPLLTLVGGAVGLMLGFGLSAARPAGLGGGDLLRHVLANARTDTALLLAAAGAYAVAAGLALGQRLLGPAELLRASLGATRALGMAFATLFLAWSLGHVAQDLGTSLWLCAGVRDVAAAWLLPLGLFLLAGLVSFATGTSFGTMAILLPNVVVLAHQLGQQRAFTGDPQAGGPALLLLCLAAVLDGAIFGDHCSPVSDTTLLSALGAQCDLMDHVTTQLPYSLLGMAAAALCGYLPMTLLGPQYWPLAWLAGGLALAAVLWWRGGDPDAPAAPAP